MDRIDKALKVLDSDISGYRIAKEADISKATISRYRSKKLDVLSLRLGNILELSELHDKYLKNK